MPIPSSAPARAFAAGMFPMADIDVEQHTPLGTMDPVFNPQITRLSDGFLAKAYAEIEAMGGTDGPLKAKYAFLEKVLDIKSSPAYRNDTTAFGQFPSSVHFEVGKEPMMTGGLKMACSASDALTLQYYEEPDAAKSGFGHKLSEQEWAEVSSVKDWYQDVLFAAPSVAANVAHPMLRELLAELRTSGRKFAFLCGHDSNIGSVLAALGVEPYNAPAAIRGHRDENPHRREDPLREVPRPGREAVCRPLARLCFRRPAPESDRPRSGEPSDGDPTAFERPDVPCRRPVPVRRPRTSLCRGDRPV